VGASLRVTTYAEIDMQTLSYIAIPTALAEKVRASGKSPGYGHPTHTEVATGHGPCRHCLRTFEIGAERRTLFTYDPFHGLESLPLPGPVYVHADACERYDEDLGFPADLLGHPLTLVAYGEGRRMLDEVHVMGAEVQPALERLFDLPAVRYVHVRDRSAGCYDLRVERAVGREVAS
jgi:hypothetical protein